MSPSSEEELRRRGVALQAALPAPGARRATWARRWEEPSEGRELAGGAADLVATVGAWGAVLAVPGVVVWLRRRRRGNA